jgi:hypothetical protein
MFGPITKRNDGTFVFATPAGQGHVPMIALEDLGFWARYTFDNREATSARDLEVASDMVDWEYLVSTFKVATGQNAVIVHLTMDDWADLFNGTENPVANERPVGDGSTTWRENFSGWWAMWRDDIVSRDMQWIRSIHPGTHNLEKWMKQHNYKGEWDTGFLKNTEDAKSIRANWEAIAKLQA